MRFRPKILSLGYQIQAMHADFPDFSFRRTSGVPTWYGTLQPTANSPVYQTKLVYRLPKPPQVWITTPTLRPDAPHCYKDKSLCLYYPKDQSWQPNMKISRTFIPWAALWLAFYEIWLETDQWYGEEAPHQNTKK